MTSRRYPANKADPSPLGQPLDFAFSGLQAKNRFLKGAMTERLSTWNPKNPSESGVPTKELINVYRRWGEGGFGLILSGNFMLFPDQLEAPGNAIIPRDSPFSGERFEAFKELATVSKKHGSLFIAQISHVGRQVPEKIQPNPIAPSEVQLEGELMGMTFGKPRAMEEKDFESVIDSFAHSAEYCYKAGFNGVQLHGAHGYLLAQFLSPTTNKRTDKYGGSLANRSRIIFEIADAIRARVPDKSFSLGIKVNSVEFQDGGFTPEDCKELCAALERHEFDHIELSGGTYQSLAFSHRRESSKKREAFFLEFADTIIPALSKTKVYVTGGLRTVEGMVKALNTVDGVGLARPAAHEFDLPQSILDGKVQSAIQPRLDESNFGITNVAAGTAMRTVGKDKEPLDLSREDHLDVFMKSMQSWGEKMADNKDNAKYGYVDVEGLELPSFGTPYAVAA